MKQLLSLINTDYRMATADHCRGQICAQIANTTTCRCVVHHRWGLTNTILFYSSFLCGILINASIADLTIFFTICNRLCSLFSLTVHFTFLRELVKEVNVIRLGIRRRQRKRTRCRPGKSVLHGQGFEEWREDQWGDREFWKGDYRPWDTIVFFIDSTFLFHQKNLY